MKREPTEGEDFLQSASIKKQCVTAVSRFIEVFRDH